MPYECPAEAHAQFRDRQQLVKLTQPGARLASTEQPAGWTELRHCLICASTFLLHGSGDSTRWLYVITDSQGETVHEANVLEQAAAICARAGIPAAAVKRYLLGQDEHHDLTVGEAHWLEKAIIRGVTA